MKHCGTKAFETLKDNEIATVGELLEIVGASGAAPRRVFIASDAIYDVDGASHAVRIQALPEGFEANHSRVAFLTMDETYSLLVH